MVLLSEGGSQTSVVNDCLIVRFTGWKTELWISTADWRMLKNSIQNCLPFGRRRSKLRGLDSVALLQPYTLWAIKIQGDAATDMKRCGRFYFQFSLQFTADCNSGRTKIGLHLPKLLQKSGMFCGTQCLCVVCNFKDLIVVIQILA